LASARYVRLLELLDRPVYPDLHERLARRAAVTAQNQASAALHARNAGKAIEKTGEKNYKS
jgi:hypothetical protein